MEAFGSVRLKGQGEVILPAVTRVTIVDERYTRAFEQYDLFEGGVELHIQDGGRTLKVVPLRSEGF